MLRTYMQNGNKRARLAELGRTSYVSKSGMSTLLHEFLSIPDDELPEHLSRSTIMRACADVQKLDTPYGLIFQTCELRTRDGELGTVHYLSPMPLFWHLVMECAPFREAVKLALERNPPSLSITANSAINRQISTLIMSRQGTIVMPSWPASQRPGALHGHRHRSLRCTNLALAA